MSRTTTGAGRINRRGLVAGGAAAGLVAATGSRPARRTAAQEPVTLEFWNTFSDAEIALLHQFGDEYMAVNPNVKINFFEIPHDQRPTKIPTAVETNTLPDIIRADYPYQWYLSAAGKLLPLNDRLQGWDMLEGIYPVAWQEVTTADGQIVGIPQDKFTSVICYNADKFARDGVASFPTTWEEFVDVAKKLTHDDEYAISFQVAGDFSWELEPLILQGGGRLFDDEGKPTANTPEAAKGLQFVTDLVNTYKVTPTGTVSFAYGEVDDALKSGKVGMGTFGSWQIANYRENKVPFELGIAAWPAGPGGRGTVSATTMYMVSNTTKHPDEAVALLKWIVSKENALRWATTLDHEPIDKFTAADPHFQQPIFKAFAESLEFAHVRPRQPRWNAISAALNEAGQKAVLQQETPEAALAEFQSAAEEVVSQGG